MSLSQARLEGGRLVKIVATRLLSGLHLGRMRSHSSSRSSRASCSNFLLSAFCTVNTVLCGRRTNGINARTRFPGKAEQRAPQDCPVRLKMNACCGPPLLLVGLVTVREALLNNEFFFHLERATGVGWDHGARGRSRCPGHGVPSGIRLSHPGQRLTGVGRRPQDIS